MPSIILRTLIIFFLNINQHSFSEVPVIVISAGKTIQSLNTVGTQVSVIDKEQIENSNEVFLGDLIRYGSSNLNMFQSGGHGGIMGIQIRGLEKRYSTVYVNGVKMSDPSSPDNSFYIQNLLKNSIEKVEILKGNQSTLYGPNAIGGTINIFTKKGKEGDTLNSEVTLGSNNSKSFYQSLGGVKDDLNYYVGINRFFTDGISSMNDNDEKDGYSNSGVNINIGYDLSKNLKIQNTLNYIKSDYKYDAVPSNSTDLNDKSKNIEGSYSLKITNNQGKHNEELSYYKTYIERKTVETDSSKQNYFGYRDTINLTNTYNFSLDDRLVYGIEAEFDAARYAGDYAPSATNFVKTLKDKEADEQIVSQFFDYQFRPFSKLYGTFGIRNDRHSSTGKKLSGRSTFAYNIDNNHIIRSSIGSGIRFPSLYDLHYADGNTSSSGGGIYNGDGYQGLRVEDIYAERANSIDVGYEIYFRNLDLKLDSTLFYIEQKNPLNSDNRNNYKMANTKGINTSRGLEFALNSKLGKKKNYEIDFYYNFTSTYDSNTCEPEITFSCNLKSDKLGTAKVRVPRNTVVSKITHKPSGNLSNSFLVNFVDERRDFGNINNSFKDVILEDYLTVDYLTNYKLNNFLNMYLSVKNIFEDTYEETYQYSSPGRSLNIGLKMIR